jgi:hypothetical protein
MTHTERRTTEALVKAEGLVLIKEEAEALKLLDTHLL